MIGHQDEKGKTVNKDGTIVDLAQLSSLTEFPKNFIKQELKLGDEEEKISIHKLREKVLSYLDEALGGPPAA